MPRKTFTLEDIVGKLRQIEVLMGQGKTVSQSSSNDWVQKILVRSVLVYC